MSAVYLLISISKNVQLASSSFALSIHTFFKPYLSKYAVFFTKHAMYLKQVIRYKSCFIYNLFSGKSFLILRKIILYISGITDDVY